MADALVLAAGVDGVLLTVQPGRTRLTAARTVCAQFERADARIVGLTLNRVADGHDYYYGGYGSPSRTALRADGRKAAPKHPA